MKADWNDAPDYIRTNPRRRNAVAWFIPGIIGTCVTLAMLHAAGSAFLKGTVQNLANKNTHSRPAPVAEITRPEPVASKDWDRIVEEQARRDQQAQASPAPGQAEVANAPPKQTVFNDNNYIPRGANNVVSFTEPPSPVEQPKPAAKMKVTVIKQTPSMKDRACWPHKEGSIERRNCRASIGLNYRD
ncbi:hypothetical protein I0D00_15525 [Pseudomonas lalucatii]|uniref:Uncharacterized protein n=1 Tax=Pseudomonas lalucatii TaxID=1424203 RepID=A0ABS5Q3X7_9PSED|nr:hypothetical protein [Pseudomonas lalucatii]MBS7663339.1 hypothetical protein [Pseudomonas lalucatii]